MTQHLVDDTEAGWYHRGLLSRPVLVARTGTTPWNPQISPEFESPPQELRPLGDHPLRDMWKGPGGVGEEIIALMSPLAPYWTSLAALRIGSAGKLRTARVVLWIGVRPRPSLVTVAHKSFWNATNFSGLGGWSISRSKYTNLKRDPTAALRDVLAYTLGGPISCRESPSVRGTSGFFIQTSHPDKLYLVTNRHVVVPDHAAKGEPLQRAEVLSPGNDALRRLLNHAEAELGRRRVALEPSSNSIPNASAEQKKQLIDLTALPKLHRVEAFLDEVESNWSAEEARVLGRVLYSPPIAPGPGGYLQDVAVIELDQRKIDRASFPGNVLDIGLHFAAEQRASRALLVSQGSVRFRFPLDRLHRLRDTLPSAEHHANNNIVFKQGAGTELTYGIANDVDSYVRTLVDGKPGPVALQWTILRLPHDPSADMFISSDPFAHQGDSGSAIVDAEGYLRGLVNGGSDGINGGYEITYATPIHAIMETIRAYPPLETASLPPRRLPE